MVIIKIIYFALIVLYVNNCFAINAEKLLSPLPLNNIIYVSDEVKPNIIALIDNSNFTSKSQVNVLLDALINDADIKKNQRWGLAYLYNKKDPFFNIEINISLSSVSNIAITITGSVLGTIIPTPIAGTLVGALISSLISSIISGIIPDNIKIPINSHLSTKEVRVNDLNNKPHFINIKSSIKNYDAIGPTIITRKYYNLTKEIRDGNPDTTFGSTIQYACQPNYIVILSNGINYLSINATSVLEFINGFSQVAKDTVDFEQNIPFLNDIVNTIPGLSLISNITSILVSVIKLLPDINSSEVKIDNNDDFVTKYIYNLNEQYIDFNTWKSSVQNKYGSYGLAFLSENISNNKITDKYLAYDSKSTKWDNDIFPNQNIDTIVINVKTNNNNQKKDYSYLKNGSSYIYGFGNRAFFKVLDIDQFKNTIIDKPLFANDQKKHITSNPLVINLKNDKRLIVIAEENPKNWSTILHFKELDKNEDLTKFKIKDLYNNSYIPEFGNLTNNSSITGSSRRFIISTGESEPEFLKNDTYNNWLMRVSNKSDKDLMLRNRCLQKQNNCNNSSPQRMIGDIGKNNILHIEDKTQKNSSFIVTAANDGMVHIFKNTNDNNKFQLILNYVPGSLLRNSQHLWDFMPITAKKNYGTSANNIHQFLLNGGISFYGITKKNCSSDNICSKNPSELIIVGSAGQGAKGIYALSIAGRKFNNDNDKLGLSLNSQDHWLKDIPLWESSSKYFGYNKNDEQNYKEALKLGFVIGNPAIAPITLKRNLDVNINQYKPDLKSGKYYATFVNNGLFNQDNIPTLYIFNLIGIKSTEEINSNGKIYIKNDKTINDSGKIIKKISVPNDIKFSQRQGLSPVTLVDIDNDGIADIAYAGDYQGNMYRFDFRKSNVDNWKVTRIYKGAGLDENSIPIQPITTAPTIYKQDESGYKYVVIFGTGSNLFLDDIKEFYTKYHTNRYPNKKFQSIYGIYDDLNSKNFEKNDYVEFSKRNKQLVEQKITKSYNKIFDEQKITRTVDNNIVSLDKKGWFLDFSQENGNSNEAYTEEKIINNPKVFKNSVFFTTEFYKISKNDSNICSQYQSSDPVGWIMGLNAINGGHLNDKTINFDDINKKISGMMIKNPGPVYFIHYRETYNLNKDGQFQNGWEETSLIPSKKYDEGSLFIYDDNNLMLFSNKKNYLKYKRISWREIF